MKRLAIVTTHPIQYYAPVFRLLTERKRLDIKVFYTLGEEQSSNKHDIGFGRVIQWDIPLLEGYSWEFLSNVSRRPGTDKFSGIDNPGAVDAIGTYKPDAILIYGWANKSHLHLLRHFKGKIPVLFRGDSTLLDIEKSWKKLLRNIFLKWVYRHIDLALYVGTANKKYFSEFGLSASQLVFVPHAIDNLRFSREEQLKPLNLRADLGVTEKDNLILFAGKLEPKKNPAVLLQAVAELSMKNLHVLVVGNGILEESLKRDYRQFGNIHFMDFQNQLAMPVVYQACDLFCLPSSGPGETWGLAVNEAMAAGKAVLVSDKVGCAIDLVKEDNGAIFRCGDADDLKQKLIWLTGDKKNLVEMGQRSVEIIRNWSFAEQARAIENILNEL